MKNVSDKSYRKNKNKHFTFNNFSLENRAFYETVWKPVVEPEKPQMTLSFGAYAFIAG
jgi:hypothetical protein